MRIALTERFQSDVRSLDDERRARAFDVVLSLPKLIGDPHLHGGAALRKLHRSGIWEARVGLGLRLVFALEKDLLTLVRVGSHEDVRRYLRDL